MTDQPLICAEGLTREFTSGRWPGGSGGLVGAVRDVTLDIFPGETLALVGHSGCGKSTLGRLLVRLIQPTAGRVYFRGVDLAHLSRRELQKLRQSMQIIFQDPSGALNPRMTVRQIITEPLLVRGVEKKKREKRLLALLDRVALGGHFSDRYPPQLSGGQKQRVSIARALACDPDFIVADEPLSALDSITQARILDLLVSLQEEDNIAYLFIAHDMRTVRYISDRVAVMYRGQLLEIGPTPEVFDQPLHPYTRVLLDCVLALRRDVHETKRRHVTPTVSDEDVSGCLFFPLCKRAQKQCRDIMPELCEASDGHFVRCINPES
ncbi:MAG: oligopeptide/dipeptide ABC transporter ATP-binding protein [Armatimonadota bacterium]